MKILGLQVTILKFLQVFIDNRGFPLTSTNATWCTRTATYSGAFMDINMDIYTYILDITLKINKILNRFFIFYCVCTCIEVCVKWG